MAVSKAQQKAVNKYMAANYDRINLTVPKGQREVLQAYAENTGESVNGFINRAIGEAMGTNTRKGHQNAAGETRGVGDILTPAAAKTAQEAAQKAGETVSAFIERAVMTQAQRDKVTQGLTKGKKDSGGVDKA